MCLTKLCNIQYVFIGTFVIASAITSKYARSVSGSKSGSSVQYLVVLLLGVGRMVVIKLLGYQVSESHTLSDYVLVCCIVLYGIVLMFIVLMMWSDVDVVYTIICNCIASAVVVAAAVSVLVIIIVYILD